MNEIEQYDETFGPSTQVRAIITVALVASSPCSCSALPRISPRPRHMQG